MLIEYVIGDRILETSLSKICNLSRQVIVTDGDWCNSGGRVIFWKNRKGNFKITENPKKMWNVYFGLQFTPSLIKDNLTSIDDLKTLYLLLVNEELY
jgi:hypothetical protein